MSKRSSGNPRGTSSATLLSNCCWRFSTPTATCVCAAATAPVGLPLFNSEGAVEKLAWVVISLGCESSEAPHAANNAEVDISATRRNLFIKKGPYLYGVFPKQLACWKDV